MSEKKTRNGRPGDTVRAEQSLITVESAKAPKEIPCSHAGVAQTLKVQMGDKVSKGSVELALQIADAAVPSSRLWRLFLH